MTRYLVVAISGSPSPTSKTALIADYGLQLLAASNLTTRHISIRELPAAPLLAADEKNRQIAEAVANVMAADGVIVATPVYKASYSGLLKSFLDLLPQFALAGKAVLPIASGGSLAHVLALDYGLRPVLQSMGARHIVQSQFIQDGQLQLRDAGIQIRDEAAPAFHEAIYHFKCALEGGSIDHDLGHPRPPGRSVPRGLAPDNAP